MGGLFTDETTKPKATRKRKGPDFTKLPDMPSKLPRKARRRLLRELDREETKIKKKITKAFEKLVKGEDLADYVKANMRKRRSVQFFHPDMLTANGHLWENPLTGQRERARLDRMIMLEHVKVQDPQKTEAQESYKQVHVHRDKLKSYLKKSFTELKEVAKGQGESDLLESIGGWEDLGFQDWNLINTNLKPGSKLPYPPGPYSRQLYTNDDWLMLANASKAYNYNPLAKAIVDTKTAFVVGTGPRVIIKNEALKQKWEAFTRDEDYLETLTTWTSMLSQNGELFVEFYLKPNGNPTVRSIDPGTVYEIITEPRDIRQVYGYRLMYTTQYQIFGEGAKGEQVPLSEFVYETIKPDNVMHLKVNVQENEKRGRSDLLSILWVCQLFEDYLRYKVIRAMVECAFAWDVTLTNGDPSDIDAFVNDDNASFPAPNSTYVHNENVKREATQFTGAAAGSGRDGVFDMLVTIAAVGGRVPKEYIGVGADGTRANAITSTEPSVKEFELRRHKLEMLTLRIIDFLAKAANVMYEPSEVEIAWPEIAPENATEKIRNVFMLHDRMLLTLKRTAEMVTKELGVTNYDFVKELQEVLKEMTTDPLTSKIMQAGNMGGMPLATPPGTEPAPPTGPAKVPPSAPGAVPRPAPIEQPPNNEPAGVGNGTRREVKVAGTVK